MCGQCSSTPSALPRRAKGAALVSGSTHVIGIIGDPVSHSLSPRLQNAAFAKLGLDYVYVPLPVRAAEVGAAVKGLAALGFRGANVTIPHKGAVIPYLDELSEDARLAQAVNTIVVDDGHLRGYNTDVEGVRSALVAVAGDSLSGDPALILGAGGAARAAALALARLGCPLVIVESYAFRGRTPLVACPGGRARGVLRLACVVCFDGAGGAAPASRRQRDLTGYGRRG